MSQMIISGSPHVHTKDSVARRMWLVVVALLPALGVGLYVFGHDAWLTLAVSVVACLTSEWLLGGLLLKKGFTLANGSALITGILLAMNLPAGLPWWMSAIGGVVAIGIGKVSFGGLGTNIWNPALVGRVFLLLSFPAAMTTWSDVTASGMAGADATSGATILSLMKSAGHHISGGSVDWQAVTWGGMNGSLGEVSALAIILGFIFLLVTRVITWHIPVSVLGSAALLSWMAGANPGLELLSGGLLLGAVFMATDYVTSPMTPRGQIIYGIIIGCVTVIIRIWGAYPEGVSFAILLGNSITPLLNRYCRPHRFGVRITGYLKTERRGAK